MDSINNSKLNKNNFDIIEESDKEDEVEYEDTTEIYCMRDEILFNEFLTFVELFIHSVIYLCEVYPKETFKEFKIYNLHFLKYNIDEKVIEQISDFIENIEKMLFNRFLNKIYILIINADTNTIVETFNIEVNFSRYFYDLNYEELCSNFKSVLYKLYVSNKIINVKNMNKTFLLCIETNENKYFSSLKLYDEINQTIDAKFVRNLFKQEYLPLMVKHETLVVLDDTNFTLNISHNCHYN